MDDFILDGQPEWRYCRVRAGEKRPYPADWQKNPLELWAVDSGNVGLLLGPVSGGIAAIDFDGYSAYEWAEAQGIDLSALPTTPTWTSGKPGRCQMTFKTPPEYWSVLSTKKITNRTSELITDGEGFEFRWAGTQSVIPPSLHPDTGRPYDWLIDGAVPVAQIPGDMLLVWLNLMQPAGVSSSVPEPNWQELDDDRVAEVNGLVGKIKERHILLPYDDWCSVAWAVAKELGRAAGEVVMREYYPEQRANEYRDLYRNWNAARSPGMGTLYYMAGSGAKSATGDGYKIYQQQQKEIAELEKRIKEMRND